MQRMIALILLATVAGSQAEPLEWKIDPDHFSVAFEAMHIGYAPTLGLFLEADGQFVYDPEADALRAGEVTIKADSVFTNHDRRDRHLRDEDFLAAEDHPEIRFVAGEYRPTAAGEGTLQGQLTLRGQTHPVELRVKINRRAEYPFGHGRDTLGISARTTILRSQWGMTYAVQNDLVGDEVVLRFEFEAIRQ